MEREKEIKDEDKEKGRGEKGWGESEREKGPISWRARRERSSWSLRTAREDISPAVSCRLCCNADNLVLFIHSSLLIHSYNERTKEKEREDERWYTG